MTSQPIKPQLPAVLRRTPLAWRQAIHRPMRLAAAIAADERATVIYESGSRVAETLRDLAHECGAERPGALCRELTKMHEEVRRGSLVELAASAASGEIDERGEFVIVVGSDDRSRRLTSKSGADEALYRAALAAVVVVAIATGARGAAV